MLFFSLKEHIIDAVTIIYIFELKLTNLIVHPDFVLVSIHLYPCKHDNFSTKGSFKLKIQILPVGNLLSFWPPLCSFQRKKIMLLSTFT